jgi:eukaryotic-like serine/threonine-protein kinase
MSTKIGHFEILSELAKSPTGVIYKANDPESGQTIALKAIQLSAFGDGAAALEQALMAEVEACKVLSSPNITNVTGAGVFDGQFCASMEYIQGNSIATMLARKEGFSIWDLLDIGRQLTSALEHAKSHNRVHFSLEPAKIMCGWDGTVRILSFGVSSVGNFVQQLADGVPSALYYMSPEQVLNDTTDARSNLFSLGAIFYEMVTERKAFERDDVESLKQCILDSTPVAPAHVNQKVHPLLSDLIMKALSKDPAGRYQSGKELLDDLEKCKESKPVAAAKTAASPKAAAPVTKPNPVAQAKFAAPAAAKPATPKPTQPAVAKPAATAAPLEAKSTLAKPVSKLAVPKADAAAAGIGGSDASFSSAAELDLSSHVTSSGEADTIEMPEMPSSSMSSAAAEEPEVETFEPQVAEARPKIAVDPMMSGGGSKASGGVSFSEMTELPPLKEVYIPPPPPPQTSAYQPVKGPAAAPTVFQGDGAQAQVEEKPKIQPREVAEKAIKEIKSVPPKLMGYALGGAAVLILVIGIAVTIYIHSLNSDEDASAGGAATTADTPAQTEPSQPAPKKTPAPAPVAAQPVETQTNDTPESDTPVASIASSKGHNSKKKVAAPAAIIPGQLAVDSTPQGAQVQLDGKSDPTWVTPFAFTNLDPGQHSITTSKAGYSTDTRAVNVVSGIRATSAVHLTQLMATLVVKSDPPGANIYVDGHDVGTKTPAQVSIDKGQHVVLLRMSGYIDETASMQFVLGQTFNFAPTLRSLGNTENIKTMGKVSKLFGGKGAPAGQGMISIHTQPKGAQVTINQHMLDKNSPVDVALDPGNYVVDITLSGYAPIHKVVTADKGGKVVVDEVLQPQ